MLHMMEQGLHKRVLHCMLEPEETHIGLLLLELGGIHIRPPSLALHKLELVLHTRVLGLRMMVLGPGMMALGPGMRVQELHKMVQEHYMMELEHRKKVEVSDKLAWVCTMVFSSCMALVCDTLVLVCSLVSWGDHSLAWVLRIQIEAGCPPCSRRPAAGSPSPGRGSVSAHPAAWSPASAAAAARLARSPRPQIQNPARKRFYKENCLLTTSLS